MFYHYLKCNANFIIRTFVSFVLLSLYSSVLAGQQKLTYSSLVEEKIRLVEDSLVDWGITHQKQPILSLKELMQQNNVPGLSIAVINDHKIEWAKAYGWANKKDKIHVTTTTAFRSASVSKAINALAFAKLAQDKKINLHQDINEVLTTWKFPYTRDKPITTYQLLTHTSGIWSHWTSSINHGKIKPTLIKMLDRKKSPQDKEKPYLHTYYDPGMKFQYSNAGVSVSQQLLIELTGSAYEDHIKKTVFEPLQMSESFYVLDKKNREYALGYKNSGKQIQGGYRPVVEYAPAGLWTTPTDLAKFVIEIQKTDLGKDGKVINKESADLMLNSANMTLPHSGNINPGLGLFLASKGDEKYFFHGGDGSGYTAKFIGSRNTGKGVAVMLNTNNESLIYAIINRVAEVYDWPDYLFNNGDWIDPVEIDQSVLNSYAGNYTCEKQPMSQLEIKVEDGRLHAIISGGEDTYLIFGSLSQNSFWAESNRLYAHTIMKFVQDENDKVMGLTMSNPDITTNWKRAEQD